MRALEVLIQFYQKWISPSFAPRCKYYPSCSNYTLLAMKEHGVKGLALGIWRFIRCNPWSHGGVDYPPTKKTTTPHNTLQEAI